MSCSLHITYLFDIALALTPCSAISSELSAVLQKSLKTSSKELDRMETVLYKHSKAVKVSSRCDEQAITVGESLIADKSSSTRDTCQREYNALDEVILINDKRMAAAGKLAVYPINSPS
jgi:hypothetical protein